MAQIPALLLSIATGLLVTRVGGQNELAKELGNQLTKGREALRTAGVFIAAMAILPGLPKIPFLVIGAVLFATGGRSETADAPAAPVPTVTASPDDPEALITEIRVEPLELHLAYDILDLIDVDAGGDLLSRVRALRRQIAAELGYVMPLVRTRDDVSLSEGTYRILLHGVEVARGSAPRGKALALPFDGGGSLASLGGVETTEPVFGLPAYWIPTEASREASTLGATVVDRASVMVTHLAEVARRHAADLLSRQDVQVMVESLRNEEPLLANEVGSEGLPLSAVHAILRGLLSEQVSVRDLTRILDAASTRSRETRSIELLVAAARTAVGAGIVAKIAPNGILGVATLDPIFEASLHESLRDVDGEIRLVLDPGRTQKLREGADRVLARPSAEPIALVCAQAVRGPLQRLLAGLGTNVPVLAYPELPGHVKLVPKGVIGDVNVQAEASA